MAPDKTKLEKLYKAISKKNNKKGKFKCYLLGSYVFLDGWFTICSNVHLQIGLIDKSFVSCATNHPFVRSL